MNNDIWSPRKEPLELLERILLKSLGENNNPPNDTKMNFINNRLRRAWRLRVINSQTHMEFQAIVLYETGYKDAIQNQ